MTGRSTAVLLYGFYTVLLGILQEFHNRGSTRFYWEFHRGSTLRVLHDLTGSSTGVLLCTILHIFTGRSTGILL